MPPAAVRAVALLLGLSLLGTAPAAGALLVPKLVPGWSQAPATAKPPAGGDMPATGPRWRLVVEKPGQLSSIGFRWVLVFSHGMSLVSCDGH